MGRRKQIKLKWKNILLFFAAVIIVLLIIIKTTKTIQEWKKQKEIEEKEKMQPTPTNTSQTIESKLTQLNNIQETIDYFNEDYIDRYISYKNKNKKLEITQVIKNVNMNLDQEPYEFKIKAKNTNTEKILVNKYYYLEENYIPNNLEAISIKYALSNMRMVKEAKEAFEQLSQAAKKEELNIVAMSTYRSYNYQVNLYKQYIKQDGKAKADTYSGRPGHSEHQTGLAVDVYNIKEDYTNFEKTQEFTWMQNHAHEYGFILRFPKNKEKETGYQYEAWHYRYVGVEIATYIHENNISFEEYYATKIKDW